MCIRDRYYVGEAVCRHKAIVCAIVAAENGYKTRMIDGSSSNINGHIQTQAFIEGEWRWLCLDSDFIVFECSQDDFAPEREFSSWGFSKQYVDLIKEVNASEV